MRSITLYRADVESPRLARLLARVPGVAVAADDDGTPDGPRDETAAPSAPDESDDDGGLRERVPVPDIDEETTSVVRRYGLLGLGVSLVLLGVSTVGIWVYLRRRGDDESETPPPATGIDTGGTASTAAEPTTTAPPTGESGTEPTSTDEPATASDSTAEVSIVNPDKDDADDPTEPERGRTEGDRSEVEWTTRETTAVESDDETAADDETATDDETTERPTESVDAAPLLGAAFLALTGVVVRWLQSDDEA